MSKNKILFLFYDIIVLKGEKCWNLLILGSRNTFQASWIILEYTFLILPPKC